MKGFKIFLCVLIFLLAVVSAVFSFFLFEKRAQLVDGWGVLTKEINRASSAMDEDSGTKVAQKLTPKTLAHTAYKDLPAVIKDLAAQARAVVAQRNNLAQALAAVGNTLEMRDVNAARLQDIASSTSAAEDVMKRAQEYKSRQDAILTALCQSASQLGAGISASQLKSANYSSEYAKFETRVSFWTRRHAEFCSGLNAIARNIGVASPNLSEGSYGSSIADLASAAQTLKASDTKNARDLAAAQREIMQLKQNVAKLNDQVASLNQNVADRKQEISNLCSILGLENYQDPIADGSTTVRRMLKGKVLSVDKKFGFVTINIGTKTRLTETYGNRTHEIDPKIAEGTLMTVGRDLDDGNPQFVCRIKLARLSDHCAVGEIQPGSENAPEKGDTVYLSEEDIAALGK